MKQDHGTGWWVYGLYCPSGCLCYVGMTKNLGARMRDHSKTKPVGGFRAELHSIKRGAQLREVELILRHSPHWNKEFVPPTVKGIKIINVLVHKPHRTPCMHGWTAADG